MQEKKAAHRSARKSRTGVPPVVQREKGARIVGRRQQQARRLSYIAASCLVLAAHAAAKSDLSRFKLAAPIITFVDENAARLVVGDFDGDARRDFAVFDTKKNLLRLFYGRDKEDEPFEKEELVVEQVVTDMKAGDLNGDGRDDILLSADPPAALYQKKGGRFAPAEELEIEGQFATVADLDGDGRFDLVTAKGQDIRVALQQKEGRFGEPAKYRSVVRLLAAPDLKDLDGDGRADMLYADPSNPEMVVFRLQDATGGFGVERMTRLSPYSWAQPSSKLGTGKPGLALTDGRTGVLKVAQLEPKAKSAPPILSAPRLCAFDIDSPTGREIAVTGDLDQSGAPEIALLSPKKAEALIYSIDEHGALSRRNVPSLSGVAQAQMVAGGGGAGGAERLWLLSPEEEALGILSAEGKKAKARYRFPRLVGFGFKPMAFAVSEFGGDTKTADLVAGYKPKKGEGESELELAFYRDLSESATRLDRPTTMTLPDTKGAELVSLHAADVNNDDRTDQICFFDYKPLRILLQDDAGRFAPLKIEESAGAGVFNQVTPPRLRVADVTGDGKNEILVARSSFARALAIGADGAVAVADQFNGQDAKSNISAAVVANLDGAGRPEVVLLDAGNDSLTIYAVDEAGAYKLVRNEKLEGLKARELLARDLNADGKDDLILVANDRFGVIFGGVADGELKMVQNYITDIENGRYSMTEVGDFDADGRDEIVALENTEHLLDLFRLKEDLSIERFYRFNVFEGVSKSTAFVREGIPEPRELVLTDFDGDGRLDIVALCYREVLIYLAQEREKGK